MPIIVDPSATPPPLPETATSSDGALTVKLTPGGVQINVDFSGLSSSVHRARILRGSEPVYGADTVAVVAGRTFGFDAFAPPNAASSWIALGYNTSGAPVATTTSATLTLPELLYENGGDCWLRPFSDYSLHTRYDLVDKFAVKGYSGASTFERAHGSPVTSGSFEVMVEGDETWTVQTFTLDDLRRLRRIMATGMFHRQVSSFYGFDDQWMAYVDHDEGYEPNSDGMSPERWVTIVMRPVEGPVTIDSPLRVPGRSYADTTRTSGSYANSQFVWPTYEDRSSL